MRSHKEEKVIEKYEEKARDNRVRDVFKIFIAATNAGTRFMIRHGSYLKFEGLMRTVLPNYNQIALTSTEVRKIWNALWTYAKHNRDERRLQPGLLKQYEKERRTMSHDARPDEDGGGETDYSVETATKGQVH